MILLLIIALVLIFAGAYLLTHYADGLARLAGGALVLFGVILALVVVLDLADVNVDDGDGHAKSSWSSPTAKSSWSRPV